MYKLGQLSVISQSTGRSVGSHFINKDAISSIPRHILGNFSFHLDQGTLPLTSSPPSADGCRLRGKGVDSFYKTLMSKRENVGGGIDVAIVECTALHTPPFPYS